MTVQRAKKKTNNRAVSAWSRLRDLRDNEDGAVLIYVTMISVVMLGMGVLAIDAARLFDLNTQLQNAADAAALAAASKLDGTAGSRDAARAAAISALQNQQNFAQAGGGLVGVAATDCATVGTQAVSCIGFLKSLPASDDTPVDYDPDENGAVSDAEATFAEVRVAPETMDVFFGVVEGVGNLIQTWARAIASRTDVICNMPPVFICNPVEQLNMNFNDLHGRQVRLDKAGGSFGPGNFGLLCPLDDPQCGSSTIRDYLGSKFNGLCLSTSTELPTKPGVNTGMVMAAINSRLDIYPPQTSSAVPVNWRDLPEFAPAKNVTQGGTNPDTNGQKCQYDYDEIANGTAKNLPPDKNLDENDPDGNYNSDDWLGATDSNTGAVVPALKWNHAEYFRINHGGDGGDGWRPPGWNNSFLGNTDNTPTRYQTYRYEIEMIPDEIVVPSNDIWASGADRATEPPIAQTSENGNKQCFNGPVTDDESMLPETDPEAIANKLFKDRRIITFASVNCIEQGGPSGRTTVKPDDIVFGFLTEPAGPNGDSSFFLEIIVPATMVDLETALGKQIVQIYRR